MSLIDPDDPRTAAINRMIRDALYQKPGGVERLASAIYKPTPLPRLRK